MNTKRIMVLPIVLLSLAACSSTQTYTVGNGKDAATATVTGDGSNGQITVKGADGKNTATVNMGSSATYPGDFPFPQYPSSKVTMVMDQSGTAGVPMKNVTLECSDGPAKVVAHYKTWFSGNGWTVNAESLVSGVGTITAQNGGRTASVMAMPGTPSSGATSIQIVVSSDK